MKSILRKSMVALLALSMILTSLGTLGFTASAAVNNNLLVNGDFENGTTGFSTSGTTTFEVIADPDNAANHVLHVVGGASGGGYHQVVTVEKNTDYVFTFRMKDLGNVGGTKINVHPDGAWNSLITSIEEDSADAYSALADGVATVATYNQTWQTFTVKFNSGDNTTVKLWHNMWAANREVYMDDWTLYKVPQTNELLNGDFSLGTTGFIQSGTGKFEVIAEPNNTSNKILHVVGGGNYYQIVNVEPNTEYTWTFRMKDLGNTGGTKINVHPDGAWTSLISSLTENSSEAYSAVDANGVGTVVTYNQTWQTFTVKFNSGDNTIVKLWHNMWANTREVYMDDWTLSNENSIPEEPETDIASLLQNGSFISGTTGYSNSGTGTFEVIEEPEKTSNHVLHVVGGASGGGYWQTVAVEPYKNYVWTFRMKDLGNTGGTKICVHPENAWNSIITSITEDSAQAYSALADGVATVATYDTTWQTFTVKFNSGNNTAVKLWHNMWASTREVYMDDWTLFEIPLLNNADFESETVAEGFYVENITTAIETTEVQNGSQSLKLDSTGTWENARLYKDVEVVPNTDYTWTFWYKSYTPGKVSYVGVRTTDGTNLLPSFIRSTGTIIDNPSFNSVRPAAGCAANWHATLVTESWNKYSVTFNSGDNTVVLLTVNMHASGRGGYIDNWDLSAASGSSAPEYEPKINGVSIVAGTDTTVNYYSYYGKNYSMKFTMNKKETVVEGYYDASKSMYVYQFKGVTPERFGDNIKAELMLNDEVVTLKETFSVLDYLKTVASKTADDLGLSETKYAKLKAVANDMLHYGAAAQKYFGYKTSSLVNEGITEGTEFVAPTKTDKDVTNKSADGVTFTGQNLYFDNVNSLMFRFTVDEQVITDITKLSIKISDGTETKIITSEDFEKIADNTYVVYSDDIYATEFDTVFTATACVDGKDGANVKYSVNSYVYAMCNKAGLDADMLELAKATYNYGISAKAYAEAE